MTSSPHTQLKEQKKAAMAARVEARGVARERQLAAKESAKERRKGKAGKKKEDEGEGDDDDNSDSDSDEVVEVDYSDEGKQVPAA